MGFDSGNPPVAAKQVSNEPKAENEALDVAGSGLAVAVTWWRLNDQTASPPLLNEAAWGID
jgi:hypothetical protein